MRIVKISFDETRSAKNALMNRMRTFAHANINDASRAATSHHPAGTPVPMAGGCHGDASAH
jgi:hypothetical protein